MFLVGAGTWFYQKPLLADVPLAKELTISQLKITGDEFIILHNTTSANLQLANFWLQYFNDFDLTHQGVTNSLVQLPSVILQPGQEIMLTVGTAASCGPVWVSKLSFSPKDSAGMIQVINLSQSSGIVGYKPEDQVSWSSKSTDPVDIKGVSSSASAQIYYKSGSAWTAVATPPGCNATSTATSPSTSTPDSLTKTDSSPPSVLVNQSSDEAQLVGIPQADAGLMAPQLSEILPNPASPKTDADDEYIELYNPNDQAFDLNGFKLKAGLSGTYTYAFPDGQNLKAHEFKSFYSSQTHLSLSNSLSQVWLLSPADDTLAESDIYTDAQDNQSWVLADGLWQWTANPTPDAVNLTGQPSSTGVLSASHSNLPSASASVKHYAGLEISELLPNAKKPQTDANDEFVELYNPNKQTVDLSGYVIVTGTKDNHKYVIKNGSIQPGAYKAFYRPQTNLTLSNTDGRAKLLAPDGSTLDTTGSYAKAPDGQSWIYAQGKWQWTTIPTPGKANILTAPVVLSDKTATNRSAAATANNPKGPGSSSGTSKPNLNGLILAEVGSAALLYGLYEYRHDLANTVHRIRRHREARRAAG